MKRSRVRKIFALLLTLVMVFSMTSMAFAGQSDNGEAPKDPTSGDPIGDTGAFVKDDDDESNIQAVITKVIQTGVGTEVPQMKFTFKFEQVTEAGQVNGGKLTTDTDYDATKAYDSQGQEIIDFVGTEVAIPDVSAEVTAKMGTADAGWEAPDNSYKTLAIPTSDFFANWPSNATPGVYVYKVTEYLVNTHADNYKVVTANAAGDAENYLDPTDNTKHIYHHQNTDSASVVKGEDGATTVEQTIPHAEKTVGTVTYEAYDEIVKEVLEYSDAEYTIYVYVKEKSDGSGTYVYALGTVLTKGDADSVYIPAKPGTDPTPGQSGEDPAVGSKANPTPWEIPGQPGTPGDPGYWDNYEGDKELDGTEMNFKNQYTKYKEGDTTPHDHPDPEDQQLTINKKVTGNATDAEYAKYFDFDVTIKKTLSANDEYYYGYIIDDETGAILTDIGANYTGTNVEDVTTASGATVKAIKFNVAATGEATEQVKLKHGQTLAFMNVPIGTLYSATETLGTDYNHWKPEAKVYYNNAVEATLSETVAIKDTDDKQIGKSLTTDYLADPADPASAVMKRLVGSTPKNGADFENEYTKTPPTGILMNNLGFFAMVIAAIAIFIGVAVIRAKLGKRKVA